MRFLTILTSRIRYLISDNSWGELIYTKHWIISHSWLFSHLLNYIIQINCISNESEGCVIWCVMWKMLLLVTDLQQISPNSTNPLSSVETSFSPVLCLVGRLFSSFTLFPHLSYSLSECDLMITDRNDVENHKKKKLGSIKLEFRFKTKWVSGMNLFSAVDPMQAAAGSTTESGKALVKILSLSLPLSQGVWLCCNAFRDITLKLFWGSLGVRVWAFADWRDCQTPADCEMEYVVCVCLFLSRICTRAGVYCIGHSHPACWETG